jgi:uncharacterized protein YodC (DUF2158 family)
MFHRRIIVNRHYGPDVLDVLYIIKMTNLPIRDVERFDQGILSTSAIHTHEVLLELLTGVTGSEEKARQILSNAMGGDTIEVMMLPQADTKLVERLKKSSAVQDEPKDLRLQSRVRLKSGAGPAMTVTEIKSERLVRCSWYENDLPRTDSFDPRDLQELG